MGRNLLACRLGSYKQYAEAAWEHLPSVGVHHVEVPLPAADELPGLHQKLARAGLQVSCFQIRCDLNDPGLVEAAARSFELAGQFGVRRCFTSVKTGGLSREQAYERLRWIGREAEARGIVVVLETHPDLATNGAVALETMQGVDHPCVRINFDTANIYYYNPGADAVAELRTMLPYVEGVHLKDTHGGYQQFDFPTLGEGVVDFPGVFGLLNSRGFFGPFTMELEGTKGLERNEEQIKQHVAESVAYLRRSGCIE